MSEPTLYSTPLAITSQFSFCGLPLRLDSYRGCAFRCTYCFARNRGGNSPEDAVRPANASAVVRRIDDYVSGRRTGVLAQFFQRRVPLHFGGMSDPLQPAERRHRVTEQVLRGLVSTRYPTVLSTRGAIVGESPYWELLRDLGAVVQFSFSSTRDAIAEYVEPHATRPSELLRVMDFLSARGIIVTCRWQPWIPGVSELPEEFVPRVAATGCRHLAFEHLKLPLERRDNAWSLFPVLGAGDLHAQYRRQGAVRDGRELVLPATAKLGITLRVRTVVHHHGMSFGAADNELQYLSDGECCCSGVDRFPGFENFFRHQIGYAVHKSRGRAIHYSAISGEWAPHGSIDRYLNSRSRISTRAADQGSLSEHVRARWNDPKASGSPASFFGVVASSVRDSAGNIVYGWTPGQVTCPPEAPI
jgi:DNA repair photolyase